MSELIDRFLRSFVTGCFVLLFVTYLLVEKAVSFILFEKAVPTSQIAIQGLRWSGSDYGLDDKQISVEAEFRNNSHLQLIELELDYQLFDCPTASAPRSRCRPVQHSTQSTSVDTPVGFRGRFISNFIVQGMATPQGVLVLDAKLTSATGVRAKDDRN